MDTANVISTPFAICSVEQVESEERIFDRRYIHHTGPNTCVIVRTPSGPVNQPVNMNFIHTIKLSEYGCSLDFDILLKIPTISFFEQGKQPKFKWEYPSTDEGKKLRDDDFYSLLEKLGTTL